MHKTNWTTRIEIKSTTNAKKKHILAFNDVQQRWGCSCPGWRFVRKGQTDETRTCKHVRAVEHIRPDALRDVESALRRNNIFTDFQAQVERAKQQLLAAGYQVEDAIDEVRLQQEAELMAGGGQSA